MWANAQFKINEPGFVKELEKETAKSSSTANFRYHEDKHAENAKDNSKFQFNQIINSNQRMDEIFGKEPEITVSSTNPTVDIKLEQKIKNGHGEDMVITEMPNLGSGKSFIPYVAGTYNYYVHGLSYNHVKLSFKVENSGSADDTINISDGNKDSDPTVKPGGLVTNDFNETMFFENPLPSIPAGSTVSLDIVGEYTYDVTNIQDSKIIVVDKNNTTELVNVGFIGDAIGKNISNPTKTVTFESDVRCTLADLYKFINDEFLQCNLNLKYDENILSYSIDTYNSYFKGDVTYKNTNRIKINNTVPYRNECGINYSMIVGGLGYALGRSKGLAVSEINSYISNLITGTLYAGNNGYSGTNAVICAIGYADYLNTYTDLSEYNAMCVYGEYYDKTPYTTGTIHEFEWNTETQLWNYGPNVGNQWSLMYQEETSPGTWEGTVPGPLIKALVGDIVNIKINNNINVGNSSDPTTQHLLILFSMNR